MIMLLTREPEAQKADLPDGQTKAPLLGSLAVISLISIEVDFVKWVGRDRIEGHEGQVGSEMMEEITRGSF